jgi:HEAT repeat protein
MEKSVSQSKERLIDQEKIVEEKSVKATRALIQTFLQTVKAFRLYEANHPILLKFLERLKKDFDNYFEEFDSFPLLVGEHRLFYRGKVVYENQDVKESLAFFFFKDGIREIKFLEGLEFREVVDFLHVVRRSESVNRMEDDLVTLLWEKDFSHITFGTVDEFLEGGSQFVPATEEDFVQRLEFKGFGKDGADEIASEREREEAFPLVVGGLKQVLNPSPGQSLVEACLLSPDEIEEINREVEQEYQPDYLYVLVDNLIEILLHLGEDMDAYENMISYFERTARFLLEQREVRKAVAVLRKLNDTMESMVLKDKQIFAIRRILDTFSGSRSIELLGEAMKGNGEVDSEAILQYLRFLTKKAVEPLCYLLGKVESGKWRKALCDTLADLAREEIKLLIKFLSDPNPFLVCHVLYVLGKIRHPSTVKYLGNLAVHENPKVREETLQVLKKLGDRGKDLLQKFLKDPMPEMRAKASLIFVKVAKAEAAKPLTGIILSEDFYKRDYEEKASFLKALGETGAEEVIPVLQKIARKKRWFKKGKWDEMRFCAHNTLKMLGVDEGSDFPGKKQRLKHIARSIH